MGCGASKAPPEGKHGSSLDGLVADAPPAKASTSAEGAAAAPPPKYAAEAPVPLSAAEAEEPAEVLGDDVGAAVVALEFGSAKPGGKSSIVRSDQRSSIGYSAQRQASKSSVAALQGVDLGALHAALDGDGPVSLPRLQAAVSSLLPQGEAPPREVFAALFRAWDTDSSGSIDKGELVAGCQALCGGDEDSKLRLTFSCFDEDGDGHLTAAEVRQLLRGSIASAVSGLHAGLEFAGPDASFEELAEEAKGAGAALERAADGTVRVELATAHGPAVIHVPATALASCSTAELSVDAFLETLTREAFAAHDTDGNATIELGEFVAFVRGNQFLSAWFGFLAERPDKVDYGGRTSWKDAHLA